MIHFLGLFDTRDARPDDAFEAADLRAPAAAHRAEAPAAAGAAATAASAGGGDGAGAVVGGSMSTFLGTGAPRPATTAAPTGVFDAGGLC